MPAELLQVGRHQLERSPYPPAAAIPPLIRLELKAAEMARGIEIAPVAMVRELDEAETAFADMASKPAQAIIVQAIFFPKAIADIAIKYRLPSAAVVRSYARAGGLMSYGADLPHLFRRSAVPGCAILSIESTGGIRQ
jgi:hypothetical protein